MAKGDIISRLKLESGEFDSKIKRAGQELLAYSEHCRKTGIQMDFANKDAKEFAKALGSMQTVSQTARGKINELSEAFVNAKVMYKNMTDEEKKSVFGKNLATSLDQLKTRLDIAKQDLADVNKELAGSGKFGQIGGVLDTIGHKFGLTTNATELLTSKTALLTTGIGASVAIIGKATDAWAGYNAELAKQDQITQVTTGLKGDEANRMTDTMRALSDTYNVEFRDAINAANTLMSQFGKSGDQAIQLIKDGMQGMIQGDGPKLLQMIQQYAPAFRDAGVSASQLVAVIHNSEGGIFTDQNMNAIVMGIKNIRLMTKATSDALAQLGIDGEKMSKQLSDGTLTIFDALKQVSAQLQTVDSSSKTAGEVMQTVFGKQGVMAGTNLAKAIDTLNTNLDETKRQTGEVGDALANLQTANEKLNKAIRDCFEYDGWDQMATGIKSNLISALADAVTWLGNVKNVLGDIAEVVTNSTIWDNYVSAMKEVSKVAANMVPPLRMAADLLKIIKNNGKSENAAAAGAGVGGAIADVNKPKGIVQGRYVETVDKNTGKVISGTHYDVDLNGNNIVQTSPTKQITPTTKRTGGGGRTIVSTEKMLADTLAKALNRVDATAIKDAQAKMDSQPSAAWQMVYDQYRKDNPIMDEETRKAALKDTKDREREAGKETLKQQKKEKGEKKDAVEVADQMVGGINNMVSSLEGLGIEIPQGFKDMLGGLQSIVGVLQSIMMIVQAIQAIGEVGTFLGLFKNGGIVPHAATGMIIPGNDYSDRTPVLAQSGELILNRAQQGNLAAQLQGNGIQGMQLTATVRGEDIRLALNNNGRRTGRGEYVQSTKRR